MSFEQILSVKNVSKYFEVYEKPLDRLKQLIFGKKGQYYRKFWALKNISFSLKRGETVGIIGKNGSGKSTLLQIVAQTLNASQGEVLITGRVAALLELGSGFNPELTGRENIYTNAMLLGLKSEEIASKYQSIVDFADIGEFIDQPVRTYSSGMALRLAFAVIAHVEADILIVDEALAVGDAFFTQKCMAYLRKFMENGTLLFVSHSTSMVSSLCNRVIWLENGQVRGCGETKEIVEAYLMAGQGHIDIASQKVNKPSPIESIYKDARMDFINNSFLRNDIKIFQFGVHQNDYGDLKIIIENVAIRSSEGAPLAYCIGGEMISIEVLCQANGYVENPIIGFLLKDRSGQAIFGDNTYITYADKKMIVNSPDQFKVTFSFSMPILPKGEYSLTIAVASGTQLDHQIHHWINDCMQLNSESSSVCTGLVGIPMKNIIIEML